MLDLSGVNLLDYVNVPLRKVASTTAESPVVVDPDDSATWPELPAGPCPDCGGDVWGLSPDLRRILGHVKRLWFVNGHDGRVSLRDLQRQVSGYTADDLRHHLTLLEADGELILSGSRIPGTSLEIIAPGYPH